MCSECAIEEEVNVQRSPAAHTDGYARQASVARDVAAQGVAGSGSQFPYLDRIQASFGRHDISHTQAFIGGRASDASRAIGARAYTTGDRVAFDGMPSLEVAAHEAAHVVQQRQGVQLEGGIGASGDSYERYADIVARRVVQGRSAENILDAGPRGGSPAIPGRAAHELGHVPQQRCDSGTRALQRTEVDDSPEFCKGLVDTSKKIEGKVNATVTAAVAAVKASRLLSGSTKLPGEDVAERVYNELGALHQVGQSKIERWIKDNFQEGFEMRTPDIRNTKFANTAFPQLIDAARGVRPTTEYSTSVVLVGGECVGIDKFGHFFSNGYGEYKAGLKSNSAAPSKDARKFGLSQEGGRYGLGLTGVWSNADLQANSQGRFFYTMLLGSVNYPFSTKQEVTSDWNETMNSSYYAAQAGGQDFAAPVWASILENGSWKSGQRAELSFVAIPISSSSLQLEGQMHLVGSKATSESIYVTGAATLVAAPGSVEGQKINAYQGVHVEAKGTKGDSLKLDLYSQNERSLAGQVSRAGVQFDMEFER
ncbi:MAG: DUF4157 domain-containing protein [Enhygromyxa sp.]